MGALLSFPFHIKNQSFKSCYGGGEWNLVFMVLLFNNIFLYRGKFNYRPPRYLNVFLKLVMIVIPECFQLFLCILSDQLCKIR